MRRFGANYTNDWPTNFFLNLPSFYSLPRSDNFSSSSPPFYQITENDDSSITDHIRLIPCLRCYSQVVQCMVITKSGDSQNEIVMQKLLSTQSLKAARALWCGIALFFSCVECRTPNLTIREFAFAGSGAVCTRCVQEFMLRWAEILLYLSQWRVRLIRQASSDITPLLMEWDLRKELMTRLHWQNLHGPIPYTETGVRIDVTVSYCRVW